MFFRTCWQTVKQPVVIHFLIKDCLHAIDGCMIYEMELVEELSGTGSVKAFGSTQKKSSGSDVAGSSSAQKTSTVSGSVDVVESVTSAALGESGPSKVSG